MPKRDSKYMANRREEIIDAALACLNRTGIAGFSTSAICEQAGISMGALYTHFATKDEVLLGMAERAMERRRKERSFRSVAAMRRHFLAAATAATSEKAKESFSADLDLVVAARTDAGLAKALQPFRSDEGLAESIKELQAAGELRKDIDAQALATALDALHAGTLLLGLIGGRPANAYRGAMNLLLDSIASR